MTFANLLTARDMKDKLKDVQGPLAYFTKFPRTSTILKELPGNELVS